MASNERGGFPVIPELSSHHGILTTVIGPSIRPHYLVFKTGLEGLSEIHEDPNVAYCPISLTFTPPELKPILAHRQEILINVLAKAGITGYNPETAPFSPDKGLSAQPNEIYAVDSGKILGARFFTGHHLLPSSGYGVESQKAVEFNRIPVILLDSNIRISRMQPHRTIYLQYDDFDKQADEFVPVFEFLKQFEPGMGFNGKVPVLLGFPKRGPNEFGPAIDLEEAVYQRFPHLQYKYDGTVPIIKFRAENKV